MQAECWATGDGESYQGEKVPADWENDNGAKEEDYTEIKLCPLDFPPPPVSVLATIALQTYLEIEKLNLPLEVSLNICLWVHRKLKNRGILNPLSYVLL